MYPNILTKYIINDNPIYNSSITFAHIRIKICNLLQSIYYTKYKNHKQVIVQYLNDKRHGLRISLAPTGKMRQLTQYLHGKKHGIDVLIKLGDNYYTWLNYINGYLDGKCIIFTATTRKIEIYTQDVLLYMKKKLTCYPNILNHVNIILDNPFKFESQYVSFNIA